MKPGDDINLRKAFRLALAAYQEAPYRETAAYKFQSIEVATIIANDISLGVIPIICTLLYGSVRNLTPIEIEKEFGTRVHQTIRRLTELDSVTQSKAVKGAKSFEFLIMAFAEDPKVCLIKLAENLYKMRTLAHLPHRQRACTALQTKHIYVPIAHRLGLNAIKSELEDLYFIFTNKKVYQAVKENLRHTITARERFIRRMKKSIQEILDQQPFPCTIKTRIKSVSSIWNKMKALGLSFEQIYDIFALRIILDVPASREKLSCWQAYEAITGLYKTHPNRFRNWLGHPRNNGYQSLHTTIMSNEGVWVEIQIRTKKMDEIAEKGHAAHWKYKEASNIDHIPGLDTWLNQIRTILEQVSQDPNTLIDASLRIDSIEVFTHKSRPVSLPVGATVLDFAFALNTKSGLRCTGAQVNDKPVTYRHILNHGDKVRVTTADKQQVLEDWLDFAVTDKAYKTTKKFLQYANRKTIAIGRRLVKEQLRRLHCAWSAEVIAQLLAYFEEENAEDLYYKLGEGSMVLGQLKDFPNDFYATQDIRPLRPQLKPLIQGFSNQERQPLMTDGGAAIRHQLAPCHSTWPDDRVPETTKQRQAVVTHQSVCSHAHDATRDSKNPAVGEEWPLQKYFLAALTIESLNCPHTIDRVQQVILQESSVGMPSTLITTEQGIAYIRVMLTLDQRRRYAQSIKKIEQLQGVIRVNNSHAWEQKHPSTEEPPTSTGSLRASILTLRA
ncbi:MAG: HD domain-containing protein [Amoebophilaceae bacterium]|nr:HD domain-containing protein [Amoebophilaceae bacterium]